MVIHGPCGGEYINLIPYSFFCERSQKFSDDNDMIKTTGRGGRGAQQTVVVEEPEPSSIFSWAALFGSNTRYFFSK